MVQFDMVDMYREDSRTNTTPKMSDHCAGCVKKLAAAAVDLAEDLEGEEESETEEVETEEVEEVATRRCISCKALWPLSEEHFQKKGNRYGSYFTKTCKACMKGKKKRRRRPVDKTAADKPAEDKPAAAPKHPLEEPLKPFPPKGKKGRVRLDPPVATEAAAPSLPQGHQHTGFAGSIKALEADMNDLLSDLDQVAPPSPTSKLMQAVHDFGALSRRELGLNELAALLVEHGLEKRAMHAVGLTEILDDLERMLGDHILELAAAPLDTTKENP